MNLEFCLPNAYNDVCMLYLRNEFIRVGKLSFREAFSHVEDICPPVLPDSLPGGAHPDRAGNL